MSFSLNDTQRSALEKFRRFSEMREQLHSCRSMFQSMMEDGYRAADTSYRIAFSKLCQEISICDSVLLKLREQFPDMETYILVANLENGIPSFDELTVGDSD